MRRCRDVCTCMLTRVYGCVYIYIYIRTYRFVCVCWSMRQAYFVTRVHGNPLTTCATLETIWDGKQVEAAGGCFRLAYQFLHVQISEKRCMGGLLVVAYHLLTIYLSGPFSASPGPLLGFLGAFLGCSGLLLGLFCGCVWVLLSYIGFFVLFLGAFE